MFSGHDYEDDNSGLGGFPLGLGGFGIPGFTGGMNFSESYRCFPVDELPGSSRVNVNFGGKTNLNISYPMLFELKADNDKYTYAGVLEFIAEEGRVYVPRWMMTSLQIEKGEIIEVTSTQLKKGKFIRIQPQSPDFLDITDPKAVLENAFRNFSCLTNQEIITINYNEQLYDILIMETKPEGKGISIIETDLEVDFAEPKGYIEPSRASSSTRNHPSTAKLEAMERVDDSGWKVFSGAGHKLTNRAGSSLEPIPVSSSEVIEPPIAPLKLPFGRLFFGYRIVPPPGEESDHGSVSSSDPSFSGNGHTVGFRKRPKPKP